MCSHIKRGACLGPENPQGQYYLTPGTFYYCRIRTQSLNLERKRLFCRQLGQARILYFLCRTGQINWRKKLWDRLMVCDIPKPVAIETEKKQLLNWKGTLSTCYAVYRSGS
jgi:hypothetical protein